MTTTTIDWADARAAGAALRGNWKQFACFCWHRRHDIEEAEEYAIVYTHNRDSRLLETSNAEAVAKSLRPFLEDDDVLPETHDHWAVGHVDGFAIRCLDADGGPTPAWEKYCELQEQLTEYPVL